MDWNKAKRDAIRNCLADYDTADLVRLYNEMAEQKSNFWGGFIGIRETKKGFMVYCSIV